MHTASWSLLRKNGSLKYCPPTCVLLQENEWDPDAHYDCPDGFYHASTAQVRNWD